MASPAFGGSLGRTSFLRVLANAGNTCDLFRDDDEDVLEENLYDLLDEKPATGFGLELGTQTPLGPVQLILSGSNPDAWPSLSLNVGYVF